MYVKLSLGQHALFDSIKIAGVTHVAQSTRADSCISLRESRSS